MNKEENYVHSLCAKIQERFGKRIVGAYADKYSVKTAVAEANKVKRTLRAKIQDLINEANHMADTQLDAEYQFGSYVDVTFFIHKGTWENMKSVRNADGEVFQIVVLPDAIPPKFWDRLGMIYANLIEEVLEVLGSKAGVSESIETLKKAGFLVEASDKAKSIRDQITRAAIEKFEEIPYDEFEQEPWEDSDAIDAIPDEKFFKVMKSAINVKTQEEVLQAAEDEDKFNILADAWLEYLSDLSGYVGWEYTWNRDY